MNYGHKNATRCFTLVCADHYGVLLLWFLIFIAAHGTGCICCMADGSACRLNSSTWFITPAWRFIDRHSPIEPGPWLTLQIYERTSVRKTQSLNSRVSSGQLWTCRAARCRQGGHVDLCFRRRRAHCNRFFPHIPEVIAVNSAPVVQCELPAHRQLLKRPRRGAGIDD